MPRPIEEIIEYVENLGGVLTLTPVPDDGSPEISWGDHFFYYAPDGIVPRTESSLRDLLREAHARARGRRERRQP